MCLLRINVWHDHDMYLLRIHSQIKTFHPNLQPRDIFYPLTFSWPWLFYKHPDTFSRHLFFQVLLFNENKYSWTSIELLHCTFPLPASYWCPGKTSANHWRDYLRATFIGQPLVPFPRWLHSKCSEVIWLPTQIKIFSFHIRSHCDCQKTKCMRICYNFASYKVVWIPDCEKLCLNPGPICLKVD